MSALIKQVTDSVYRQKKCKYLKKIWKSREQWGIQTAVRYNKKVTMLICDLMMSGSDSQLRIWETSGKISACTTWIPWKQSCLAVIQWCRSISGPSDFHDLMSYCPYHRRYITKLNTVLTNTETTHAGLSQRKSMTRLFFQCTESEVQQLIQLWIQASSYGERNINRCFFGAPEQKFYTLFRHAWWLAHRFKKMADKVAFLWLSQFHKDAIMMILQQF